MNNYERYYRRAYNALQKLIKAYKDGYNPKKMSEFRESLRLEAIAHEQVIREEQLSIMFTTTAALLGLNKESIERTSKISEYKKPEKTSDFKAPPLPSRYLPRIAEFNGKRTQETPFDSWLSIIKDQTADKDASSVMKKIRNGILHSNFELLLEPGNLDYTNIKIKSYFEAEILNTEFEKYVFEYFANIEGLGLTEVMYTYNMRQSQIKDKDDLHRVLEAMSINEIRYENIKTLAEKTPEDYLMDSKDENDKIDVEKFLKSLIDSNNFENLKGQVLKPTPELVRYLEDYISKTFGKDFYKLSYPEQNGIITTHLNLVLNPKRELSNWLVHFWYLYSTIASNMFNPVFFSGDEYGFESCLPSLLVLKSYLVLYRLQSKDFAEIDYRKINFPLDGTIELISENPNSDENTFSRSIEKEQTRNPELRFDDAFHKVICDVVRNSLAHGNVNVYLSPLTLERKIELTDIDPKTKSVRKICFELESFNDFLNSDAFSPKNCYNKKEDTKIHKKDS